MCSIPATINSYWSICMELDREQCLFAISSLYQAMVDAEHIVSFNITNNAETAFTFITGLKTTFPTGYKEINIKLVMK